jgi:hypothetical protein
MFGYGHPERINFEKADLLGTNPVYSSGKILKNLNQDLKHEL